MTWSGTNRRNKETAREKIFVDALSRAETPIRSAIMLPAHEMLCIQQALSSGVFDLNTKCLCVERNQQIYDKMCNQIETLKYSQCVPVYGELHKTSLNEKIDFAFLDFNGPLIREICLWVESELRPNIISSTQLAFSFLLAFRNNKFIHEAYEFFQKDQDASDFLYNISFEYKQPNPTIATYIAIFRLILHPYTFDLLPVIDYRDSQTIIVIRLVDFKETVSLPHTIHKPFMELVGRSSNMSTAAKLSKKTTKKPSRKMSEAGKKAWKTRRKKEKARAKKASAAAKKAWKTRRKSA